MLPLNSVWVTQGELRDADTITPMVQFVREGRVFNRAALEDHAASTGDRKNPPLVAVTEFPDGLQVVHDGHHRCVAALLGDRNYLFSEEYVVTHFTYTQYTEINIPNGWFTPFDPRIQTRLGDFKDFKKSVKVIAETSVTRAVMYINAHPEMYIKVREIKTVRELADRIKPTLVAEPDEPAIDARVKSVWDSWNEFLEKWL